MKYLRILLLLAALPAAVLGIFSTVAQAQDKQYDIFSVEQGFWPNEEPYAGTVIVTPQPDPNLYKVSWSLSGGKKQEGFALKVRNDIMNDDDDLMLAVSGNGWYSVCYYAPMGDSSGQWVGQRAMISNLGFVSIEGIDTVEFRDDGKIEMTITEYTGTPYKLHLSFNHEEGDVYLATVFDEAGKLLHTGVALKVGNAFAVAYGKQANDIFLRALSRNGGGWRGETANVAFIRNGWEDWTPK